MQLYLRAGLLLLFTLSAVALECPNAANDITIPQLDIKRFHYKIQISIPDLNQTLDGYEFYDHENKTTFIFLDKTIGNQSVSTKMAYDYKINQTFIQDELTNKCTVKDIDGNQDTLTLFGAGVENGLQNITYAFRWNANYNATHMGEEIVDEITTDHFQTCLLFNNGSVMYVVDVYFSTNSWTMPSGQKAPVMLTLNATTEDSSTNITSSRLYSYKFSDYHTSASVDVERPDLPGGVICAGRKDAPYRPTLAEAFQLNTELEWREKSFVEHLQEFYDYNQKLYRLDQNTPGVSSVTTVHDFRQGLQYNIDLDHGNCSFSPLPVISAYLDIEKVNSTHVKMANLSSIFTDTNITYGGIVEFDGFRAHSWIGQNPQILAMDPFLHGNNSEVYSTFYFTVDAYNNVPNKYLGLRQKVISKDKGVEVNSTELILHLSDFKNEAAPITSYDISPCYMKDQKETIVVKFPGDDIEDIVQYPNAFKRAVISASAKYAKISEIRIAPAVTFSQMTNNKNETELYVWITVLGVLNVNGTSVEMVPQLSLADAIRNFNTTVMNNEFTVTLNVSGGANDMTAFPDYMMTEKDFFQPPSCPVSPSPSSPQSGTSTGVVVGVAFAMLIAGIMLGCIVMIWRGKRTSAQYAYTMQD